MSAVITIPPPAGITNSSTLDQVPKTDAGGNLVMSNIDNAPGTVNVVADLNAGANAFGLATRSGISSVGDVDSVANGTRMEVSPGVLGIAFFYDNTRELFSILTLPTVDPGVSGALWRDPILNTVLVSP